MDFPAIDHHRKRKPNVTFCRVLDGTSEDLAIGKIFRSVTVDPDAVGDGQAEIRVWPLKMDLLLASQPIDQPLLHRSLPAPGGRGIVRSQLAGVENEGRELRS